jgi:hypothetical protein
LLDADVVENLGANAVVALVNGQAQLFVGFYGVEAHILQRVSLELVDQADAAPLLAQVDDHAAASRFDHFECGLELHTAVAP